MTYSLWDCIGLKLDEIACFTLQLDLDFIMNTNTQ